MFKFFRRHFKRLRAMNRGPRYHLGDVMTERHQEVDYRAVMKYRFAHTNRYGDIVNRFEYLVDGSATWWCEKDLVLNKLEVEEDMTVCNA